MGMEKQGPKSGNYVGEFLQLFDWKAKSRKKLFSTKSDIPEQSKHKKRCDGNFPTTRLQILDEDETAAASSARESCDYSYASSVNDEDFNGTKAPGVIARLMGLDCLPTSNILEPNSTPLFDSKSLSDAYFRKKILEYCQDSQITHCDNFHKSDTKPKYLNRPIEKFQTEILPPKSAKTIPITHHKLLSPIKSSNFSSKDAAHIMQAAARIIEPRPQAGTKTKLPHIGGSSSVPLKIRGLKEKVQESQKRSKISEISQRPSESIASVQNFKGHSMNKSWNEPIEAPSLKILPGMEESSVAVKNKGKSISLALQAKANVQKREGLNLNTQKETCELNSNEPFKSEAMTHTHKRSATQNGSNVLRPNNQKQNCAVDRGKSPLKSNVLGGKALNGDSSSVRQKNTSKASGNSKVSSRKMGSEFKDDKSSERINCKKRSIDGNYHSENTQMDKNGKKVQSCEILERKNSWERDCGRTGSDVISFTFTAPLTRSGQNSNIYSTESRNKRSLISSDNSISASKFSFLEHNVKGGDSLSTLLEQKLKELTYKVEFSQKKTEIPDLDPSMNSEMLEENKTEDGQLMDYLAVLEERDICGSHTCQVRNFLDSRLPSSVSVLEHSSFAQFCNSTNTTDINSTQGSISRVCSSTQAHESKTYSYNNTFRPIEGYYELSDSASSISAQSVLKKRDTTLTKEKWALQYINEILCDIVPMFKNFASGRASKIINPNLFDQLENKKLYFSGYELVPKINRRVLFDCASECLDLRCRQYVGGGYKLWAKGLSMVRRKERLPEEVYKEISGWNELGDSMVDQIVDKDMSCQYGKWLDFDIDAFELGVQIETRLLNSLIDEVIDYILML